MGKNNPETLFSEEEYDLSTQAAKRIGNCGLSHETAAALCSLFLESEMSQNGVSLSSFVSDIEFDFSKQRAEFLRLSVEEKVQSLSSDDLSRLMSEIKDLEQNSVSIEQMADLIAEKKPIEDFHPLTSALLYECQIISIIKRIKDAYQAIIQDN